MAAGSKTCQDLPSPVAEAVVEHVRAIAPPELVGDLTLDTPLLEVGLDSLARMDVVNRLEQGFRIRFSEESLYDLETCRDLVELVESCLLDETAANSAAPQVMDTTDPEQPAAYAFGPQDYFVAQFPECVAFEERLRQAAAAGLANPYFRITEGVCGATTRIGGNEVISYTSFDYLGMASHARIRDAAKAAIDQYGTSASASRLVGGNSVLLEELDAELARFLGAQAAAVFPNGYGTNASLLGHLFGADDLILYDELAHNSIVQGCQLSAARRRAFPHNDVEFVDELLRDIRGRYRRVAVAIEGVYSMDGDYPDLPRFLDVKRRHHALLYVDEAHSVGPMGATGRGLCEHFGVSPDDGDIWMGTISKALASAGGYIAGHRKLVEYLKYTTPAFVFSTGSAPAAAAAALAAVRVLRDEPDRVAQLRDRAHLFLSLARDSGFNTGTSRDTPIIPIILGNSQRCLQVSHRLLQHGINAQPILFPAVPEHAARVRFFITANHTASQIRQTIDVLRKCIDG
ncbi:MAG: aminotransferase class I/II-fold pyridoxal phosphate-dependent enzyme [Pirellulaceae bacterium]|nr:aminotransferase class I/II-fold pyridoxal phosphate-dependent enzyme [Pirellulaceae bacterium]